jgi:hypothetical protein
MRYVSNTSSTSIHFELALRVVMALSDFTSFQVDTRTQPLFKAKTAMGLPWWVDRLHRIS